VSKEKAGYHHGDLRRALLDQAASVIEGSGIARLSLRDLARRVGVSHAAPAHHFHDKTGLLTALAVEGFQLLEEESTTAYQESGSFLEVGVAYVRFAVEHPAHFEVMFQPGLLNNNDIDLLAARQAARARLYPPAARLAGEGPTGSISAGLAAWSLVHGLASLWLNGALPDTVGDDPEALTRSVASHLFVSPG
jgi:AcrR family transcriptional regulator